MPRHILIVDDDPDICHVLQDRLESYGYRVEVAADGHAALLSINRSLPQGLILDLNIPHIDGHEVLCRVREHHPLLPVIIITADISQKLLKGAQEVLFKPIDGLKLKELVARWFSSAS
jgi:DNA-binding response OmpR family regulator